MSCERWPTDAGPCGRSEVERLWYVNEWMDHPGHGQDRVQGSGLNPSDIAEEPGPGLGLGLCATHLTEYLHESCLAASDEGEKQC